MINRDFKLPSSHQEPGNLQRLGRAILIVILVSTILGCENSTGPNSQQGVWSIVGYAPAGYYNAIWFVDRDNGCVVGDSGQILTTSNGGSSWNIRESGNNAYLKCVTFANSSRGWIGGRNSIGLTTDGGATWIWQYPAGESNRTFMALSFISESAGWIVDNYGGIFHTEDGGKTWVRQISGTSHGIRSVQFLDSQNGWATGAPRQVLHTTNGGNDWSMTYLDTLHYGPQVAAVFEEIYFMNRFVGWIGTTTALSDTDFHPSSIVYTSDGGLTWSLQRTPESDFINSFAFTNDRVGWAASGSGILYTNDGGGTWAYQLELPKALCVDICLVNHSRCWVLTFTGGIYRCDIP